MTESRNAHYTFDVCGSVHGNLWTCVCVRLHIHPNLHWHMYSLRACVRVCVCVRTRACKRFCECEGVVFQCVSVSLYFVWLSNVLLYYWFSCEYLCIPCCCLIKWEIRCVGHVHGNLWTCVCVRLHIHPNLHTYSLRVCWEGVVGCVRACVRVRVRACVQASLWVQGCCVSVCQFHFALYDKVSLCVVMYYFMLLVFVWVFMHSILLFN